MIEQYLYGQLSALAPTFGGQAPPSTSAPYIVFKQVSGNKEPIDSDNKANSDRWQVDSFAGADYTAGRTLAKQIIAALDSTGQKTGLCIHSVEIDGPEDMYDASTEHHYQSSDIIVRFSE